MSRRAHRIALFLIPPLVVFLLLDGPRLFRPMDSPPGAIAQVMLDKTTRVFRGSYEFGHEVRSFRECGRASDVWINDRSGLLASLARELQPVPPDPQTPAPLFVVLGGHHRAVVGKGFDAEYETTLFVDHVAYASRQGLDCDVDWSRIVLVAMDTADTWILEVLPGVMRLARPGEETLVWTLPQRVDTDSMLVFEPAFPQEPEVSLSIQRCAWRDAATGTYAGFTAIVHLQGKKLEGFAVQGDAELIHQQRGQGRR